MKTHCNPLLKSWNDHIMAAAKFVALRREGRAVIARVPCVFRFKKKGRR